VLKVTLGLKIRRYINIQDEDIWKMRRQEKDREEEIAILSCLVRKPSS